MELALEWLTEGHVQTGKQTELTFIGKERREGLTWREKQFKKPGGP